jgi:hypothetical protein
MPKTFPIMLEVEEIMLGPVLRKLNEMPGIAKLHLDLGHGGQGADRAKLAKQAAEARGNGESREQAVTKLLMEGPKHIDEISAAIGGKRSRAYGLMTALRKKGIASPTGKGIHQLTAKARAKLGGGAVPALPAPQVKRGAAGRASPGSGPILLRAALGAGPVSPADLRKSLAERGMSAKSISGVLDRGKKQGFIKKNGSDLYELTAKGLKIEMTEAAHG